MKNGTAAHAGAEHAWEPRRGGAASSCGGCALSVLSPPSVSAVRFGGRAIAARPEPPHTPPPAASRAAA